ncbi:MAG TPA: hypothetical protein VJM33_09955 [Microthrixaceae bacterium]|nr:hypothetical protein [Microthrixaceae bacterium]
MFIQVIEGRTDDPEALRMRDEIWHRDLQPGAVGYLGSTGGVTTNGDVIIVVRFESEEAAQANAARPEQSEWWAETEKCFDGPVRFHDTTDVQQMRHGGADDAGFVQVMEGHVTDREQARQLEDQSDEVLADVRPDLIGTTTAFFPDDTFTEVAYFTSEQEARAGESAEIPPDVAERFAQWEGVMKVDRYLDLSDPWMASAT